MGENTIVFVADTCITKRNVLLYTKTCNGKADGEPIAAFLNDEDLKSVKSLKSALKKILQEVHTADGQNDSVVEARVEAVYYVCKGKRNLPIVSIVNEAGIKQALKEYPEVQKNGHRSTALLRLACDWHKKGCAMQTRFSPRRHQASPCNYLSTSPSTPLLLQKKVPSHRIRIEVHAGVNLTKNLADGPIHTIHNVNSKENLSTLKKLVREKVPYACFRAGFYWLQPKQTKPLHTLLTDNDLETAKDAYRDDITGMVKVLRLATVIQSDGERTQSAKRSLASSISSHVSSKRSHDLVVDESDEDAKEFDEEAYSKFQKISNTSKSMLKDNNATWNKIHVELRKKLEETGQLGRFGMKHLRVWTDLIQKGEVAGPNEEPDWPKYKHIVDVEPITRNASNRAISKTGILGQASGMSDLLTTMLLQQEIRREEERTETAKQRHLEEMRRLEFEKKQEMERKTERNQQNIFQAMLFQALSPQPVPSPHNSSMAATTTAAHHSNEGLMMKTCSDVCEILKSMNLGQYGNICLEKGIDGSTLAFITEDGLKELGILSPLDRSKILGYVARERAV